MADDKDKIWPFYFQGAKEEYVRTVLRRRASTRISPKRASTSVLSTLPEDRRVRTEVGEVDRQKARDLAMARVRDPISQVRDAAVIALGKSGYKDAVPLIEQAAASDTDPQVREDALLALGLSGQKDVALAPLLRALESTTHDRRRENRVAFAALGLGLLGDAEGAVPKLQELYKRTCSHPGTAEEASCAAVALAMLGDATAVPLFKKVVESKAYPESVRVYTVHALGRLGDAKAAYPLLQGALKDKSLDVRRAAALALGNYPDACQLLLKEGIDDSDDYTKNFAIASLGRIAVASGPASDAYRQIASKLAEKAESEVKARTRTACQHSNLALACMAWGDLEKQILKSMEEKNFRTFNENTASAMALSLGLLGSDSPEVARELKNLSANKSRGLDVQAYAALGLAMSGNPGAAEELRKVFAGDEGAPSVQIARESALGLGLVGGREDVDVLLSVVRGERLEKLSEAARHFLAGTAAMAVGLIRDAETIKKLQPLVDSRNWQERAFATVILGYMMDSAPEPRLSQIFRHHDYRMRLGVVRSVQSIL